MAEQVQSIMDQMVPSLRDFLDKGIFSESEVRAIVKRRRESEYLLRRRVARKADFLRYIEAEKGLERLRELRTRQIRRRRQQTAEGKDDDKRLVNTSIVQHIHFLFQRALRKFRSDVTTYIQHAEFAKKSKSHKILGKIYAEALQIHPRHAGLWIEAASFEFFGDHRSIGDDDEHRDNGSGGGSILSARVLLQRGLRINAKSQDLWLQAFALELHYIQKLRGRKEILQLSVKNEKGPDGSQKSSVANENFNSLIEVPRLVYRNAVKNISNDVTFRLKFMDLCKMFPETDSLEASIISTIETDFGDTPKAWISRAKYVLENESNGSDLTALKESSIGFLAAPMSESDDSSGTDNDNSVDKENAIVIVNKRKRENEQSPKAFLTLIQLIEDATNHVKTSEMFIESVDFMYFMMNKISSLDDEDNLEPGMQRNLANIILFLDHLFTKASDAGVTSVDLVLKHAAFLLHTGNSKQAYQLLEISSSEDITCKKDVKIWLKLSEIASRIHSAYPDKNERKNITGPRQILRRGLENIPLDNYGHLIILQKLFFLTLSNSSNKGAKNSSQLFTSFQKILMLSHRLQRVDLPEEMHNDDIVIPISSVCLSYFQHAMNTNDMRLIRNIFRTIINSNVGKLAKKSSFQDVDKFKVFFDSYICAEENSMEISGKKIVENIHRKSLGRVYDETIRFFSKSGFVSFAQDYRKRKNEVGLA